LSTSDGTKVFSTTYPGGGSSILVTVPAGKDGQIWRAQFVGVRDGFGLQGLPTWVSLSPETLMVPRECLAGPGRLSK
jgi:hypothetical protein